ncbi:hypothetical protein FB567DRAFT_448069 [Paraphoma chrysanthemicola]|uniref:Uncharacterized protein n=1 Tax=Paraphoma chrysanthemicola TaxID=798071 RepID=A0A8K0VW93_9PLEO|nr:hypothetical protein FB567DRAFT_448069 [Paraphoma chrysanthemicola]
MSSRANASSFWAQKSREVKSSPIPEPATQTPSAKKGVGFEGRQSPNEVTPGTDPDAGMANGAFASPAPKNTRWADMDDDEDFLANFSADKQPRLTTSEVEIEQKAARIAELEAVVSAKVAHIQQLEHSFEEKDGHIKALTTESNEIAARLEQVKGDNHSQFLYIQELVAETDEKSRRIQELETELDSMGARIRQLEIDSESQTQLSEDDTPSTEDNPDKNVDLSEANTPTVVPEVVIQNVSNSPKVPQDLEDAIELPPQHVVSGPAVNDSKFPKLWSPEDTPKNVAPVEKPKVLKMAIDTSKFGKKPLPTAIKARQQVLTKSAQLKPYGQSPKNRTTTDVVPKFDTQKDIRHMPHAQRVLFANGPVVSIMMGDFQLAALPKFVLMQCSTKAHKHFTNDPSATAIVFPAGSMDAESAKKHLSWMNEMTYQGRVYSVNLNGDEKYDRKNLMICQAARVMGLNNTYVGHFTKVMCDRIRSNTSSTDFIAAICELATPENDPIFDCLANHLVNQQSGATSDEADTLKDLSRKYPVLEKKMIQVEQRVANLRAADKRKGGR